MSFPFFDAFRGIAEPLYRYQYRCLPRLLKLVHHKDRTGLIAC